MLPEDVDAHDGLVEGWVGGRDNVIVYVLLVLQAVQTLDTNTMPQHSYATCLKQR